MVPFLSIVIPVYNCAAYLNQTVSQIVQQMGEADYELILVNDGSTDGSEKICKRLAEECDTVRLIQQENQGASSARNHGMHCAVGEYLLFVDADDSLDVPALKTLVQSLRRDSSIDMAIFGLSFDYYHKGRCYRSDELPPVLSGILTAEAWAPKMKELYACNSLSPVWNKLIRRGLLLQNQIELNRSMIIYEDLEFSLRYMAHCSRICFCPQIIYHYRQSEDEGNAGRRLKKINRLSELVDQIDSALEEFLVCRNAEEYRTALRQILPALYCVIAREKIAVSDRAETERICEDFSVWHDAHKIPIPDELAPFADCLLHKRTGKLMAQKTYIAVRHRIAVKVKNSRIYGMIRR